MSGLLRNLLLHPNLGSSVKSLFHRSLNKSTVPALTRFYSYEGDGKMTVTILNSSEDAPLMIDAYGEHGFRLNTGVRVLGPMAIFPKTVLSWGVEDVRDITAESLSLFFTLEPKLDVLIIGFGDQGKSISKETYINLQKLNRNGTQLEILSSDNACSTFNFLNHEKRSVAAAIIPPSNVKFIDEDIWKTQARNKELYMDTVEDYDEKFIPDKIFPLGSKK